MRLRTAVVLMIKNEIDIIDAFLEHVITCFDVAYLCDNMSNDGTYERIVEKSAKNKNINYHWKNLGEYCFANMADMDEICTGRFLVLLLSVAKLLDMLLMGYCTMIMGIL